MARLLKVGEGGEFKCFHCNRTFDLKLIRSDDEPIRVEQCPFCTPTPELLARAAVAKAKGESK